MIWLFFVFFRSIQWHDERWIVTCGGVVSSGNGLRYCWLVGGAIDNMVIWFSCKRSKPTSLNSQPATSCMVQSSCTVVYISQELWTSEHLLLGHPRQIMEDRIVFESIPVWREAARNQVAKWQFCGLVACWKASFHGFRPHATRTETPLIPTNKHYVTFTIKDCIEEGESACGLVSVRLSLPKTTLLIIERNRRMAVTRDNNGWHSIFDISTSNLGGMQHAGARLEPGLCNWNNALCSLCDEMKWLFWRRLQGVLYFTKVWYKADAYGNTNTNTNFAIFHTS
jgi:hypothetical protein